jgi:hypothetical protein
VQKKGCSGLVGDFRLDEQAISFARNGLDIKGLIGGVAESLAQFIDGSVYVGVVVDVRVRRPQAYAQFLARDDFTGLFEQDNQDLINLALELQPRAIPRHFLPLLINLERSEMNITARRENQPFRGRRFNRLSHGDHFR